MIRAAGLETKEMQDLRNGSSVTAQVIKGDFGHPFRRLGFNFLQEHNSL